MMRSQVPNIESYSYKLATQAANGLDPNWVERFGFTSGLSLDGGKRVLCIYGLVWIGFRVQTVWISLDWYGSLPYMVLTQRTRL